MRPLIRLSAGLVLAFGSMQLASAADIPARAPVYKAPAAIPVYSWTGCYIGGNAGGIFGRKDYVTNELSAFGAGIDGGSHDANGVLAGGQLGCNYQAGAFVFGVEGMMDWTNADGSHVAPNGFTLSTDLNWIANVTGRVGYAWDRSLFYVKGGGAWVNESYGAVTGAGVALNSGDFTRSGWTVGGGWEYAFTPNWSAKLEYNYYDFGTVRPTLCGPGGCGVSTADTEQTAHAVLVGVNYKFIPW